MLIYLCDLTHTGQGFVSELVPYGIGCLKSYAHSRVPGLDIRLFKEVEALDAALAKAVPDVLGLSNYMWNSYLSYAVAEHVRSRHPEVGIIMGGPNFPLDTRRQEAWLRARPAVDVYLLGDAEVAFAEIAESCRDAGSDIPDWLRYIRIYGACAICGDEYHKTVGHLADGTDAQPRIKDLSEVPSPYLNGSLDEFLAHPKMVPCLACNRGCPYSCTYCVCGNRSQTLLAKYDVDRVVAELKYIAKRYDGETMHVVDNNFGEFAEDVEVARAIAKVQDETGYPKWIIAATGKSNKHRVIEVARMLNGALRVAASVQSMDPEVLTHIRRKNILHSEMIEVALSQSRDTTAYSELILGLPGDTREKHMGGIGSLIDTGFSQIRLHQLVLLLGSVMDTDAQRGEFAFRTAHRVLQRSYGRYTLGDEEMVVAESEEVVIGHQTMSEEDYMYCRMLALTVALFHNEWVFFQLARYIQSLGLPYSAFLLDLHDARNDGTWPGDVRALYDSFGTLAREELFASREQLEQAVYADDAYMLRKGLVGNNLLYNTQGMALAHHYAAVAQVAFDEAVKFIRRQGLEPDEAYLAQLHRYCVLRGGHVSELGAVEEGLFTYDFVQMDRDGFKGAPVECDTKRLQFYFEEWQRALFAGQMDKYGSDAAGLGKIVARSPMSQTARRVRELPMAPDKLVIVLGPARSGTSVTCDLVRACGYNLGPDVQRKETLRDFRNEEPDIHRAVPLDQDYRRKRVANKAADWLQKGVTCIKVAWNWDMWLPLLRTLVPDLRVLVCHRGALEVQASRISMSMAGHTGIERIRAEQGQCWAFMADPAYKTLAVDFAKTRAKDPDQLQAIIGFLGADVSVETLAGLIHPEVIAHRVEEEDAGCGQTASAS